MWLLAGFALILMVIVALLWPFLRTQPQFAVEADVDPRLIELYGQRDMLYQAIRDSSLDLQTGKLSQSDYERQSDQLKLEAASVLRAIDEIEQSLITPELDAAIEAQVSEARAGETDDSTEAEIETAVSAARSGRSGIASADRFCGNCGGPLRAGDRFCGRCGRTVSA